MPGGLEAKATVDAAIDRCSATIGNLREDIMRCRQAAEEDGRSSDGAPDWRCGVWPWQPRLQ